jgi:hypothetical protein
VTRKTKRKKPKKQKRRVRKPVETSTQIRVVTASGQKDGLEPILRTAVKEARANPSDGFKQFLEEVNRCHQKRHRLSATHGVVRLHQVRKRLYSKKNSRNVDQEIFRRIPKEAAENHLVTNWFETDLTGSIISNAIKIKCYHLPSIYIPDAGTATLGNAKVTFKGVVFNIHFMSHAIKRLRERIAQRLGHSIGTFAQAFYILSGQNPILGTLIRPDAGLLRLYSHTDLVLGNVAPMWKIAYAPCYLKGHAAGVKTILEPGMRQTPEQRTVNSLDSDTRELMEATPHIFSTWMWLKGHKDTLIDDDQNPIPPPKVDLPPREIYEALNEDYLGALQSWGVDAKWDRVLKL